MAEWKKIVVSGSDISQLLNDSGYLSGSQTIASASVAARATTLSAEATASFADLASVARNANSSSVAARATTLSADATASFADLSSDARTATSASIAALASTLSATATASFADLAGDARTADSASNADRATTASFADLAGDARTADSASVAARATLLSADATASFADLASDARTATSASIATTSDSASVAARATLLSNLATASFADLASDARTATSASIAALASTLSSTATASFADLASDARTADSASVAARATLLSNLATASFADTAGTSRAADSASVAARATLLSDLATASYADLAGTVHDGNITNAKIAAGTIANDRLVNDSVTIGTTEVDLGATVASLTGLTAISATTGTFILQVYESSSTIITSGSNIFGNDQADIQQITGSLKQSGSFTLSGSLKQSNGTISGSFEGDGSNLTGIATTLTVDGDTGTQDVDLTADDLQIIGTTDELETAVTKVGNDVKVTLGLPSTIAVTASVATRANTLAPTATASFADLASDARTATSASIAALASTLSATATASFADLASDARTADSASVAARATLLSNLATASFADSATTASHAVTATSASAIIAGASFPTTQGLAGQALILNASKDFIFGDGFGTGSTKKLNQSVAATTWSFNHALNELYPIVQAYDSDGDQLIPARVESIDANNVKLYFTTTTAGVAAAMVGGMGVSASNATIADTASVAIRATTLSADATASFADLASDARTATSASIAALASTLSATATASFADLASDARTADSASVAARATLLSDLATASFADSATTASQADSATSASHALGGAGTFSGSFLGDGSGLTGLASNFNFDGDSGATTINLLTETASFNGTAQEIETTVTANTLTIGLPTNVTIGNNLTVTNDATIGGDLVVGGSIVSASSLAVADQFIILASGSNGAIDGGIIINQIDDHPDGKGVAFAYDSSANRWALETGLNDSASVITPDAFMGVIQENAGAPSTAPTYGGTSGKGTILVDTNSDEAYIYV